MNKLLLFSAVFLFLAVAYVGAQNSAQRAFCAQYHGECSDCLGAKNNTLGSGELCYFCRKNSTGGSNQCLALGFSLIQEQADCPYLNYNIGICTVPAYVWIVLIVIFLIIVFVCCCTCVCICCCWCHRRRQRQREMEEENYLHEKDSIRQRSADRRAERKAKNDEIRKKYGLTEDTAGTYKRLS